MLLTTYLPDHPSGIFKILVFSAELALSEPLSVIISLLSLHVIVLFLTDFQEFLLAHLLDCFTEGFRDVLYLALGGHVDGLDLFLAHIDI